MASEIKNQLNILTFLFCAAASLVCERDDYMSLLEIPTTIYFNNRNIIWI